NAVTSNGMTDENTIYKTSINSGNYYLTTVDLGKFYGTGWNGYSMIFYVSVEKYDQLMSNIYTMLLVILIIATIFLFLYVIFISRSISKPMRQLCVFADEIGRGNFTQNEYDFKDRELIDLNERMNETARKLEINGEDQKTFFQNVSHELKTPLMSIGGYAEGIKYGVFSSEKEQTGAVDIIIAESDRLKDLVEDLLYISRIDATKKFDKLTNESLGELLESCAQKLRGLLINSRSRQENGENKPEKKINIHHPKNDISILCDEESLMRAIMNIASNCLRYAKSAVDISFYETGEDIILSVKDDGGGIDEKDMPNIFKRFYKGKGGKHGIGLSIAKAIIEQHHAKITAENRKDGNGAEFLIKFNKNINEGQR
ncbi:MAG: HAMP domain-containing histidine kinase, partial [Oscillospiraceae bacterium]|nr:HAMP domain-containing histidine kinase [Oscillospiraceae bacterium]